MAEGEGFSDTQSREEEENSLVENESKLNEEQSIGTNEREEQVTSNFSYEQIDDPFVDRTNFFGKNSIVLIYLFTYLFLFFFSAKITCKYSAISEKEIRH